MATGYLIDLGPDSTLNVGDSVATSPTSYTSDALVGTGQIAWTNGVGSGTQSANFYRDALGNTYASDTSFTVDPPVTSATISSISPVSNGVVDGTNASELIEFGFVDVDGDQISTGNDTVDAGDGNDSLHGGAGDDSLIGGAGNDRFYTDAGADTMIGGTGSDRYYVEDGFDGDVIDFGGDEIVVGDGFNSEYLSFYDVTTRVDIVFTSATGGTATSAGGESLSFDNVDGLEGALGVGGTFDASLAAFDVTFFDYGGMTSVIGSDFGDLLAAYGADPIGITDRYFDGGGGDDNLDTGEGNDTILGGTGNDSIVARGGDDTILGQAGADSLSGNDGNDNLDGGIGNDTLSGGDGNDTFNYAAGDGDDTIADFNSGNTGTLSDGDNTNNDFVDLSPFYDDIWELYADQADDGVLNQSNDGVDGVDYSNNTDIGTGSLTFAGASADPTFFTVENTGVTCYLAGTRIQTPRGAILIEQLKAGDEVLTRDHGPQKIRWIGASTVEPSNKVAPIRIKAGALGSGLPLRDLRVSPQHRMLVHSKIVARIIGEAEAFVPATKLTKLQGIRAENRGRPVTYLHILCDAHEVIYAEGAPSETLLPGPQARQAMGPEAWAEVTSLFPDIEETIAHHYPARPIPTADQQKELVRRHRRNCKALIDSTVWS